MGRRMMTNPGSVIQPFGRQVLCEIAAATPPGCFVEFGVFKGGSAYDLAEVARQQGRALYLYDTFEGIPFKHDDYDLHKVGDFSETSLEAVQRAIPDAICIKGIFPGSLIRMPPIAFCHVDADQYESIKAACNVFPSLIVKGGVMVFDDYGCLPGATKAVEDAFSGRIEITSHKKALVRF